MPIFKREILEETRKNQKYITAWIDHISKMKHNEGLELFTTPIL
jgi:hypothetical protein